MTTTRLRIHVLTILGLPALGCGAEVRSVGDGEPIVLEIPTAGSAAASSTLAEDELDEELFTHPAARAFDCGVDRTRAFLCGRLYGSPSKPAERPYDLCSASAQSVGQEVRIGPHSGASDLDRALTARFRTFKSSVSGREDAKLCCYSKCVDVKSRAVASAQPVGYRSRLQCIASMHRGSKHPTTGRADCPVAIDFGHGPKRNFAAPFHEQNTKWRTKWVHENTGFKDLQLCCYQDISRYRGQIKRGRPLRGDAGEVVVAPFKETARWVHETTPRPLVVPVDELDESLRMAIARRWMRDAALEHASVASFSQLSLALLACGAPPELVAEAHRSALDEIRHAEICYGLASRYAMAPIGPGPLKTPSPPSDDVVALATETFRDGCVGETVAALVASRSAASCEIADVTEALTVIAADEERHADLAWRILKWTLAFDGVREALTLACEILQREPGLPAGQVERGVGRLAEHGLLSAAAEAGIRHEVVTQVVVPCTQALLMM